MLTADRGRNYAIGLDYGTASARAVALDTETGEELAVSVFPYRGGTGGVLGDPADANLARQEPQDYVEALESTLAGVVARLADQGALENGRVVGIGVATTGSTPLPLDGHGRPLALQS